MPWQKHGAFLREERRIKHTQWLHLVGEPCGDTSSGSETAFRGPPHHPPRNGQNETDLARSYLWLPGLDTNIEDKVKSCKVCQLHRAAPAAAHLHPWEWPEKPWSQLIHIDNAGPFMGQLFLIVIDAYSKWIDVLQQLVPVGQLL